MRRFASIALLVTAVAFANPLAVPPPSLQHASDLYTAGSFAAAYLEVRSLPEPVSATAAIGDAFNYSLLRGRLARLSNHFSEAHHWLQHAEALQPAEKMPYLIEAEVYRREDDFIHAAACFRTGGNNVSANAHQSFGPGKPYLVTGPGDNHVPLLATDPLPLLAAIINGKSGNFLLDTGGSEITITPEFAKASGTTVFTGSEQGTFAGDRKAAIGFGKFESMKLGAWTISNVPIRILPLPGLSAAFGGKQIDGVIGTVLLYHFLSTIDYPHHQLILRKLPAKMPVGTAIPMWLASDHYILANGTVNHSDSTLFLIDTGLAGLAFTAPQSTAKSAGLTPQGSATAGQGGGGAVSVYPFTVKDLTLGPISQQDVPGVIGPFPESLEMSNGFRIGGLVSHAFLKPYAVTLDFQKMEIVLSK